MDKKKEEVRHLNVKPFPCGVERVKGMLVSGDKEQVTCNGCLDYK